MPRPAIASQAEFVQDLFALWRTEAFTWRRKSAPARLRSGSSTINGRDHMDSSHAKFRFTRTTRLGKRPSRTPGETTLTLRQRLRSSWLPRHHPVSPMRLSRMVLLMVLQCFTIRARPPSPRTFGELCLRNFTYPCHKPLCFIGETKVHGLA